MVNFAGIKDVEKYPLFSIPLGSDVKKYPPLFDSAGLNPRVLAAKSTSFPAKSGTRMRTTL